MLNSVHSLYNENENIKKLDGFYRGTVLKHLAGGKCKVFVYGVYNQDYLEDPDKLPDAEQAAPLYGGCNNGNGVFSYPNIGSTVWCFFQNGDQNLPVIFAATLGGNIANENYSIIKDYRPTELDKTYSNVHRINSLYSNFSIYEEGIISSEVTIDKDYNDVDDNKQHFTRLVGYVVGYDSHTASKIAKEQGKEPAAQQKTEEKPEEDLSQYMSGWMSIFANANNKENNTEKNNSNNTNNENNTNNNQTPKLNRYSLYNNKVYKDYLGLVSTGDYDKSSERQHIQCRHVINNNGYILSEAHNTDNKTNTQILQDVDLGDDNTINNVKIDTTMDEDPKTYNRFNFFLQNKSDTFPEFEIDQQKGSVVNYINMYAKKPNDFNILILNDNGSGETYIELKTGIEILVNAEKHIKIKAPVIDIESETLNIKSTNINVDSTTNVVNSTSHTHKSSNYTLNASSINESGGSTNITGGGGDVVVSGKSLVGHSHIGNHGAPTSPPI